MDFVLASVVFSVVIYLLYAMIFLLLAWIAYGLYIRVPKLRAQQQKAITKACDDAAERFKGLLRK